jgi:hypothetical protein
MGIGTGVLLFAAGAILTWAVDIDLPYVTDDTLGLILMLAGAAAVLAAGLLSSRYSQSGFGSGILLFAAGAIILWAVNVDVPYFTDSALGVILVLAGSAIVGISAVASARHTQSGIGAGITLTVAGIILAWVVDLDLPYVADYTPGAILAIAGLASLAAALVVRQRSTRARVTASPYGQQYRY